MDSSNVRRGETATTPTEQHYKSPYRISTPFLEQQVRFRWSTRVHKADEQGKDNVSQIFIFSTGYERYSPAFIHSEKSCTGNYTPYSPKFGTVLYKTPAQHGDTQSSKIMG